MTKLICFGVVVGIIGLYVLFFKIVTFFAERHYNKKKAKERRTYPVFFRTYNIYSDKLSEQRKLERDKNNIQSEIEKEQSIMNCFPDGPDYRAHEKRVADLRYLYLCKQGAIDVAKMERKELVTKLNSLPKPEYFNRVYQ